MPYKLMILENGLLTVPEEAKLTEIGFTVPQITPYEPLPFPTNKPVCPPRPDDFYTNIEAQQEYKVEYKAYRQEKNAYEQACVPIYQENTVRRQDFLEQFPEFAEYLETIFVMTKWVDEKYVQVNPVLPNYTFLQAAQKLMGYACVRPLNAIDFICNKYFG